MFAYNQDITEQKVSAGITRKVLTYSQTLMLCEVRVSQGTVIDEHTHFHEQSSYILSGSCYYTIADRTEIVGPGDTVLVPSNQRHKIHAITDIVVLDVFSPGREDFLPHSSPSGNALLTGGGI